MPTNPDLFTQTLLLPALFSLVIYLLLQYVILPFYRRHRMRSSYLPLNSVSFRTNRLTNTLSSRFRAALTSLFISRRYREELVDEDTNSLFDSEDGEDMVGFEVDEERREALEHRRSRGWGEGERRLSRELEEGFRDDSSESGEEQEERRE
ncbi:hypothetical protein M501DRAFT_1056767 [Patellaria atrata CBS 101060]|uniref:Uncharacterized protein n=1 Tax=Patellaria atrata CBS 101060 TaxID=1346257 RepID=A0A9P4SEN8_9PEZI|nr:hypothetical protein M501DRAFT_1056767 [Patellaria atrata CBS 101060]